MPLGPAGRTRTLIGWLALLVTTGACSLELDRFPGGGPCFAESTPEQDLAANELVGDPSMEDGAEGWVGWNGTLQRIAAADAPAGRHVIRVLHTGGSFYSVDDRPDSVGTVPPGSGSYCAVAYVRSDSPSAEGKSVELNLRERTPAGEQPNLWSSESTTLSPTFQRLTVRTGTAPTEGNALDLYVVQYGAEEGDAFVADVIGLVRQVDDGGS